MVFPYRRPLAVPKASPPAPEPAPAPSLEELKEIKRAACEAGLSAALAPGFPHVFVVEGVEYPETLQVRREKGDLTNWLGLKDACNDASRDGISDQVCPQAIRCTSNRAYYLTYDEIVPILAELRTFVAGKMAVMWTKKDAVDAAASEGDLNLIDPYGGYD